MATVAIERAEKILSQLLARVATGEEIVLTRDDVPITKIVPYESVTPRRQFGRYKGIVRLDEDFFDPLPEEELGA